MFYMIQLQFFLKRERLFVAATENVSFCVGNAKFFKFGSLHLCKNNFGRHVAFLGETAKSWFVIIQNVNVKIRAKIVLFNFFNEFTNLMR